MKNPFAFFALLAVTLIAAVGVGVQLDPGIGLVTGVLGVHAVAQWVMPAFGMAAYPTLLDVAVNDKGSGYPVIDETVERYPELSLFPADTMAGISMELEVMTALPTGSSFRNSNEGTDRSNPVFDLKTFQTMIVSRQVAVDNMGVLHASKDKARFLRNRSVPQMQKAMTDICAQIWRGVTIAAPTGDAKGFPGLLDQYSADALHEVDATGASVKTSVWFLELGPANIELIFGMDQTLTMSDDWKDVTLYDANNKPYQGKENFINGRVGLRLANKHRAVRIKNLGTANGKTLTDTHMAQALRLCEDLGMVPNAIFGHGRSFEQLRTSRTTYSPTGAPAPRIQEYEGIPIHRTTNIPLDEA